jgi:hypothetical protein
VLDPEPEEEVDPEDTDAVRTIEGEVLPAVPQIESGLSNQQNP